MMKLSQPRDVTYRRAGFFFCRLSVLRNWEVEQSVLISFIEKILSDAVFFRDSHTKLAVLLFLW